MNERKLNRLFELGRAGNPPVPPPGFDARVMDALRHEGRAHVEPPTLLEQIGLLLPRLTVREVARMFEAAGVARTERSITNWCQPNRSGIARLDSYFDPNERKYYITAQSVELAIAEEKAKAVKGVEPSEEPASVPKPSESEMPNSKPFPEADTGRVRELEREVMDLKIANRGKDYFIEELQKEREAFSEERKGYVEQLMGFNRKVGELETKLLQLESGRKETREQTSRNGMAE